MGAYYEKPLVLFLIPPPADHQPFDHFAGGVSYLVGSQQQRGIPQTEHIAECFESVGGAVHRIQRRNRQF